MVNVVVIGASYRKNCLQTQTVVIDKLMKRTGYSQINLLEKEWIGPEQGKVKVKREGHDKLKM